MWEGKPSPWGCFCPQEEQWAASWAPHILLPEGSTQQHSEESPPLLSRAPERSLPFKKCSFHVTLSFREQECMRTGLLSRKTKSNEVAFSAIFEFQSSVLVSWQKSTNRSIKHIYKKEEHWDSELEQTWGGGLLLSVFKCTANFFFKRWSSFTFINWKWQ